MRIGSPHKVLEQVCFGNLRFGSSKVFTLDGLVYLVSVNRNMAWGVNTDFYIAGTDAEDRDLDLIADYKTFIFFSSKD